ncbi:MAG: hypothetical protein UT24_C0005G0045 [Candidatus Woesebacteria bacterium GW2011_GWB1_39_12]|uniref:Uncharacterized protein n=2 Tax=Candidatus Woeseibacteriota TaxID=1752722 RepID=A0A0G0Q8J6_9BACT|nr:MAG: hypothetical protein UT23_C0006G0067 [Candidatus Woesebacteria bacterium GW2011_GWA1_39_12]KKR01336.1 MAG: hypothetical protein UT24_C0005G0045 [Candidatus Woesebacteria bacterium GW2011_GWB1_39_12]
MKRRKTKTLSELGMSSFKNIKNGTFSFSNLFLNIQFPNFISGRGTKSLNYATLVAERFDSGHKSGRTYPHVNKDGYLITVDAQNSSVIYRRFNPKNRHKPFIILSS